jgi:beta-glucosidase
MDSKTLPSYRKLLIVLVTAIAASMIGCAKVPNPTTGPEPHASEEVGQQPTATATAEAEPATEREDGDLAPKGIPRETFYAPFPLSITLDGDLSDWENVPHVIVPESAAPGSTIPSITFAAAADEEFLYLMGNVVDDNIVSGQHGDTYWNEDSIEFYLNSTGNHQLTTYEPGVAQLTLPPLNADLPPEDAILSGVQGDTIDARVHTFLTDTGYAVEVAAPLDNDVWDIAPEHGATIGFQVHLNSASSADRDGKLIWSIFDKGDTSYQNPSVFGSLIFFEIGQVVIAEATATPPPLATATNIPIEADAVYRNPDAPIEDRVEDLLARMTLAEKIGQMTLVEKNSLKEVDLIGYYIGGLLSGGGGYPTPNTAENWAEMVDGYQEIAMQTRLGIPIIYGVDAVHGHNNVYGATIFPHNIGLGAASDPELMERIGQVTAKEMIATGIYWDYAPVMAVVQDIRWGRTYESYGENTDLVVTLSTAYMRGLQGESLTEPNTVLATPKHFIGDGATGWGTSTTGDYMIDQGVAQIDEDTLRALHLPPYISAIEQGALSIMASYSSWNEMKMHAEQYLLTDVLKDELGFDGFIVSDWAGIDQISPDDYYNAVVVATNAGIDMNMVPYDYVRYIETLTEAVENGDVSEERIDDAVRSILRVKFALGLFEQPFSDPSLLASVGSDEHRAVAREAVSKSLVLLKNDGGALPLAKDAPMILVAGAAGNIGTQSGGWTIEWQGKVGDITPGTTILEGVQVAVSSDTEVIFDPFARFDDVPAGTMEPTCIAVVGETPYAEGIGDSPDLALSEKDLGITTRLRERCETLIVVLISGRPLIITEQIATWDAVVAAWLPGTEGGGVTDVLFGDQPFTGKLPFTWPRSIDQLPFDFEALPPGNVLFPFGYGLEYDLP